VEKSSAIFSTRDRHRTVYGTDRINTARKDVVSRALRYGYGTVSEAVPSHIRVLRTAAAEGP
jgi:hypothetical protein